MIRRHEAESRSRHTAERVIRILRLAQEGTPLVDIGRLVGLDRHRVRDIIDGMYDHVMPRRKCKVCGRDVEGPCVACRARRGGLRLHGDDDGNGLALDLYESAEARHRQIQLERMVATGEGA